MAVRPLPPVVARPLSRAQHRAVSVTWVFWAVLAATLIGAALRLPLVQRFPLREDEAIYAFWALHGAQIDPLFLTVWPDKPPLFLWLLAAAFQVGGATPATARLLNVVLSAAAIPLVAAAAYRWWGRAAAVAAAVGARPQPVRHQLRPHGLHRPAPRVCGRRRGGPGGLAPFLLGRPPAGRRNHDQAAGPAVRPPGGGAGRLGTAEAQAGKPSCAAQASSWRASCW